MVYKSKYYALIPWKDPSIRHDLRKLRRDLSALFHKVWNNFKAHKHPHTPMNLHIGCGELILQDWINLDLYPQPGAFYLDAGKELPFRDNSAPYIHCEHFLEHLIQPQGIVFLKECFRILIPGGTLRIIVPDAEKYLNAYCNEDHSFFIQLECLGGAEIPLKTPCEVVNQMFRMGNDHLYAWDFKTVSLYLKDVGFSDVNRSKFQDPDSKHQVDGVDEWRMLESLYLNATK